MSDILHLTKESLFLKLPEAPVVSSLDELISSDHSEEYSTLIDKTFAVITSGKLTYTETLKVWEIRLTLHLHNNQLSYAKKEAINLNNTLYLRENPSPAPIPPVGGIPTPVRSRTNSLNSGGAPVPLQPIYPLPKSFVTTIDYSLVILLLRLKSIPNINLVNELYKLDYQLRLKSNLSTEKLRGHLMNLSYDTVVILAITKNNLTLLNFLNGLQAELERLREHASYDEYSSNVSLLQIIVETIIHNSKKTESLESVIERNYQSIYNKISERSKNALLFVLKHISPKITNDKLVEYEKPTLDLVDLISLITNGHLTVRILCSLLGLWDLSNTYGFELIESEGITTFGSKDQENKDDISFVWITNNWSKHINKVYGLE